MSRLVTIGCSLTEYCYPTWADMAGTHFDEYYNLGNPGCGHNYMLNIFTEADILLNLGDGDTVIVMSTSIPRRDVFLTKNLENDDDWGWQGTGNVWYRFKDDPTFLKNHFSNTYAVMQMLSSLKSIKEIYNYKNINFILLKGFSTEQILDKFFETVNLEFFKEQIDNLFETKYAKSFYEMFKNQEENYLFGYKWSDNEQVDAHPTISMHNSFLKATCPEYAISDEYTLFLEQQLDFSNQNNNRQIKLFDKLRGKKLGSLITRNFSNDYMKNFKYSG